MTNLHSIFGGLSRYHVASSVQPLPEATAGVTWIWAGNGIFKRGVDTVSDILICVKAVQTPGLPLLVPHVRWHGYPTRLPGQLLAAILLHARRAGSSEPIVRPIEQQYHITRENGALRVRVPPQKATPTRVTYQTTGVPVLCDIHSHHAMDAYFSATDDADDQGLSVSAVLGNIYTSPRIAVRANVYGHNMPIDVLSIFDSLPFLEEHHAAA